VPQLTADEEHIKNQGLILILKELHEKLDRLVFEAYGWPVAQTAAVFAALAASRGPASAAAIAAGFRKTKSLERTIAGVLASLHRLGHLATKDGKTFELRRAA
jgi:hypothetical protein